jgi:hypothetical protein
MDSQDIKQNPASAIGQQFLANGGPPQNDGDASAAPSAPASALQTAPQPAAAPAQAVPAPDPKHTAIGKMFSAITGGGSGTSASNFWRSLVGGAIVGMGAADNAPVTRGPYGDIKSTSVAGAASRGFQAGSNMVQEQQDRQRKQQQQDAEEKRKNQESAIQGQ